MSDFRLAWFVSSHGFGHAARSSAIMTALHLMEPELGFEVFTQVPKWFFADSLPIEIGYHELSTDVGLVQKSPMHEDLDATIEKLTHFLPFASGRVQELADEVLQLGCSLVICDISPLGVAVARQAGLPSVLVENFTWDWIYEEYSKWDSRFKPFISYLQDVYGQVKYRIQTEPICKRHRGTWQVKPIARQARLSIGQVRQRLNIPDKAKIVLVTMGGIPPNRGQLSVPANIPPDIFLVIPGGDLAYQAPKRPNVILLPHHSDFYHPDLINASDAVIGKVGYSTVAEAFYAGIPYGYIRRDSFRESDVLISFILSEMHGLEIGEENFENGDWISELMNILSLPGIERHSLDGAQQAAICILSVVRRSCLY